MFIWVSLCSRMGALEEPHKGCMLLECPGAPDTPAKKKQTRISVEIREKLYAPGFQPALE